MGIVPMCTVMTEPLLFGSLPMSEPKMGFVMDFGRLKPVKAWLEEHFDHTLLLDSDDPLLSEFQRLETLGACRIVTFGDVGMEGTAEFVYRWVDSWVKDQTQDRVWVASVEVRENQKNSARYTP